LEDLGAVHLLNVFVLFKIVSLKSSRKYDDLGKAFEIKIFKILRGSFLKVSVTSFALTQKKQKVKAT